MSLVIAGRVAVALRRVSYMLIRCFLDDDDDDVNVDDDDDDEDDNDDRFLLESTEFFG